MAEDLTLLAHLVPRLTNRVEDAATDALAFILNRSESCRGALNRLLQDGDFSPEPITCFETQVTYEDGSRPDMVGYDSSGAKRLVVELKFWAGLQESQASSYIEQFDDPGPGVLLFVAPNSRIETLWTELTRQMESGAGALRLRVTAASEQDRRARIVDSDKRLMLISWSRVLDGMAAAVDDDPRIASDIRQLRGLARREDEDAFKPIHPEEFGLAVPRRIRGLNRLIDSVVVALRAERLITTQGYRATPVRAGYGRYFRFSDVAGSLCLCVNLTLWATSGETPLWLLIGQGGAFSPEKLGDQQPPPVELRGWRSSGANPTFTTGVPIHLKTGVEYEAVRDDVVRQVREIAELIGAS